jgi:hypothetical protein
MRHAQDEPAGDYCGPQQVYAGSGSQLAHDLREAVICVCGRFRWKPRNEIEPSPHPPGERVISGKARGLDTDEAGQIRASELHRPYVGLAECLAAAPQRRPAPSAPYP